MQSVFASQWMCLICRVKRIKSLLCLASFRCIYFRFLEIQIRCSNYLTHSWCAHFKQTLNHFKRFRAHISYRICHAYRIWLWPIWWYVHHTFRFISSSHRITSHRITSHTVSKFNSILFCLSVWNLFFSFSFPLPLLSNKMLITFYWERIGWTKKK